MQLLTEKQLQLELDRRMLEAQCEIARRDFWEYCKVKAPKFYKDNRDYLKKLCKVLQLFFEGKLLKPNGKPYAKMIIQLPPRFGKTRTLTLFSSWIFGKNPLYKIMLAAYNDDLANQFSKFTRNIIAEIKTIENQIIYNDIFPDTVIQKGSAASEVWALEGTFFSYRGSGVNGTITGVGSNLLIIDDPVKSAEMAFNEPALEKLWLWYTSTWTSRGEGDIENEELDEYEPLEIITNTPWCKNDISGRLLNSEFADDWYVFSMPACLDEKEHIMLDAQILSWDRYYKKSVTMDDLIFAANYKMERLDAKGFLYNQFQTYTELPPINNNYYGRKMILDPADRGDDFLCAIFGTQTKDFFFVEDIIYTQDDIDKTEKLIAKRIQELKIDTAYIEENGSGHNYKYCVKKELQENLGYMITEFRGIEQSKNKEARIFGNKADVNTKIIFPEGWRYKYPGFYNTITTFSRTGKNLHDDAPDCLTSIILYVMKNNTATSGFASRGAYR